MIWNNVLCLFFQDKSHEVNVTVVQNDKPSKPEPEDNKTNSSEKQNNVSAKESLEKEENAEEVTKDKSAPAEQQEKKSDEHQETIDDIQNFIQGTDTTPPKSSKNRKKSGDQLVSPATSDTEVIKKGKEHCCMCKLLQEAGNENCF